MCARRRLSSLALLLAGCGGTTHTGHDDPNAEPSDAGTGAQEDARPLPEPTEDAGPRTNVKPDAVKDVAPEQDTSQLDASPESSVADAPLVCSETYPCPEADGQLCTRASQALADVCHSFGMMCAQPVEALPTVSPWLCR